MKTGVHQDKIAQGDGSLTVVEEVVGLNHHWQLWLFRSIKE